MPGENLDLSSHGPRVPQSAGGGRRYVGVHFVCCDVYQRIYVNRDQTAYAGHCPKCARRIRFDIGPGGTDSRIFQAS